MSLVIELPDGTLLDIRQTGDQVTVGDLTVRVEALDAHRIRLHSGGTATLAYVARDANSVWVAVGGQTWKLPRPDQPRARRRAGAGDAAQVVTPPMPGQVIQIAVAVGDAVTKGQTVAVVSAMKMETPLAAPHAGRVTAIHTEVGAQVNPGDVLVDIDSSD